MHVPPFSTYLAVQTPETREKVGRLRAESVCPASSRSLPVPRPDRTTLAPESSPVPPIASRRSRSRVARSCVDHIEYIVERIGIDHAGIGTDFDHGSGVEGFGDEAFDVTRRLVPRLRQDTPQGAAISCACSDGRSDPRRCGVVRAATTGWYLKLLRSAFSPPSLFPSMPTLARTGSRVIAALEHRGTTSVAEVEGDPSAGRGR